MKVSEIQKTLRAMANAERAASSMRFFKTGKGSYAEDDKFLGLTVPQLRALVKKCKASTLIDAEKILKSKYHEERLFALFLMVQQFSKADTDLQKAIVESYFAHTQYINNWDLVDSSAYHILGNYYLDKSRAPLKKLARSTIIWERRIAIISSYQFIRHNQFEDTLAMSKILLRDEEDLIHKAVGWMLREVGNRDRNTETEFLDNHYQAMPRTMLRYAIEKYPESLRQHYLKGTR